MARQNNLDKMSYAELTKLQAEVERLKIEKQDAERASVRQKLVDMAKQHGFDIRDLMDTRRKPRGPVAVKYRDPKNPANTWTGRGRMPRWMAAATKGNRAKKDDFLI
jgi:DNA-binding protein H-NS